MSQAHKDSRILIQNSLTELKKDAFQFRLQESLLGFQNKVPIEPVSSVCTLLNGQWVPQTKGVFVDDATINLADATTTAMGEVHSAATHGTGFSIISAGYVSMENPVGANQVAHVEIGYASGGSGGARFGASTPNNMPVVASQTYTYSYYIKLRDSSYFHPNFIYIREYNSSGVQISEFGIASTSRRVNVGNGWWRIWGSFVARYDTASVIVQHYMYNTNTSGNEIWFCGGQLEKKTYPTQLAVGSRASGKVSYGIPFTSPISVALDYYVDSTITNSTENCLFSYDNDDNTKNAFSLYLTANNKWRLTSGADNINYSKLEVANILPDGLHKFVATLSSTKLSLFIDGVEVGFVNNPTIPTNNIIFRIGNGCPVNLLRNGSAELRSNANFTGVASNPLSYTNADSADGDSSAFIRSYSSNSNTSTGGYTVLSDDLIPINESKMYRIEASIKGADAMSRYYLGFGCFDKDGGFINYSMSYQSPNTRTTLAQDLVSGSSTVYLTSATNWYSGTSGTYVHQKQIAFYDSATLASYPVYTYTKNIKPYISVDYSANTITLQSVYTGSTIPSGTAVQNTQDGGSYNYALAANPLTTTDWVRYGANISHFGNDTLNFRNGTKYIRFMSLMNRNVPSGSVGTVYLDNIVIREIGSSASQLIKNVYVYKQELTTDEVLEMFISGSPPIEPFDYRAYAY